MKKCIAYLPQILTSLMLIFSMNCMSQAWVVYDGSALPDASTPAFTAGDNSPAADFVAEVISDPDITGNKLFKYDHTDTTGKQTYKMSWEIGGGTAATIVARIKGIAGSQSKRVAEIDVRNVNSGFGSKLQIGYDDTVRLESPSLAGFIEKTSEWHLYRLVMNGADFTVYVDENTTPLITGTSTKARTDNWFKFGDQSASYSHSALFDYIIWDVSGAYAPGQGAAIPETLSKDHYGATGIPVSGAEVVKLYPNPSSGMVTIASPDNWTGATYMVINSLGQQVLKGILNGTITAIDAVNLSGGYYTLVIRSGDNTLHREPFILTSR